MQADSLQQRIILKALDDDNAEYLTERDFDFVNNLADKPNEYVISSAQNKWLNDIWGRISK